MIPIFSGAAVFSRCWLQSVSIKWWEGRSAKHLVQQVCIMLRLRWECPGTSLGVGSFTLAVVMLWITGDFRSQHPPRGCSCLLVFGGEFSRLSHYVRKDIGIIGAYPTSQDFILSTSFLPLPLSGNSLQPQMPTSFCTTLCITSETPSLLLSH